MLRLDWRYRVHRSRAHGGHQTHDLPARLSATANPGRPRPATSKKIRILRFSGWIEADVTLTKFADAPLPRSICGPRRGSAPEVRVRRGRVRRSGYGSPSPPVKPTP